MWIIALLFLVAFEGIADIFSKKYSLHGGFSYWALALGGYIVANAFWLYSIRKGAGLARGAVLFSLGSAIVAVLIGWLGFHEKVGKFEFTGIIVGIIAIALIFWSEIAALLRG